MVKKQQECVKMGKNTEKKWKRGQKVRSDKKVLQVAKMDKKVGNKVLIKGKGYLRCVKSGEKNWQQWAKKRKQVGVGKNID